MAPPRVLQPKAHQEISPQQFDFIGDFHSSLEGDEAWFRENQYLDPKRRFELGKEKLARYGVTPETVTDFLEKLQTLPPPPCDEKGEYDPHENKKRFAKLLYQVGTAGVRAGLFQEAAHFLRQFVVYHQEGETFALTETFKPVHNNPSFLCAPLSSPWRTTEKKPSSFCALEPHFYSSSETYAGYQLFAGLENYLVHNVEGANEALETVLSELPPLSVQISPERIEVKEGETLTLTPAIEVKVGERDVPFSDIRWRWATQPYFDCADSHCSGETNFGSFESDASSLKIRIPHVFNDHLEPEIPLLGEARLKGYCPPSLHCPEQAVTFYTTVKRVNENEPPSFSVAAPRMVAEGEKFCMEVDRSFDAEEDRIDFYWRQIGGRAVSLDIQPEGAQACVQTPVTHTLEEPLQFQITGIDRPPSPFESRTADKEVVVLIRPTLALPGSKIELSEETVEKLTPHEADTPTVAPVATRDSLYIFLRLPVPIDQFDVLLNADRVASTINFLGTYYSDKAEQQRTWTSFSPVPESPGLYYSSSPIRDWIKAGKYTFNHWTTTLSLRDKESETKVTLPIFGDIVIESRSSPLLFDVGELKVDKEKIQFQLTIGGAQKERDVPLKLPQEFRVPVEMTGGARGISEMRLTGEGIAQRLTNPNSEDVTYQITISIPEFLRPSPYGYAPFLTVPVPITNMKGEKIELEVKFRIDDRPENPLTYSNLYEAIDVKLPEKIMPLPWALMELKLSEPYQDFLPWLAKGRFKFDMKFEDDECFFCLAEGKPLMEGGVLYFPILTTSQVDTRRVAKGGSVRTEFQFSVPTDPKGGKGSSSWEVKLDFGARSRLLQVPGYPPPEIGTHGSKQPEEESEAQKKLKNFVQTNPFSITPLQPSVKAGETLELKAEAQHIPNQFEMASLSAMYFNTPLEEELFLVLRPSGSRKYEEYKIPLSSIQGLDGHSWKWSFKIPDFLPNGDYGVYFYAETDLVGHYKVFWEYKGERFSQRESVELLSGFRDTLIPKVFVVGNPNRQKMEGKGEKRKEESP